MPEQFALLVILKIIGETTDVIREGRVVQLPPPHYSSKCGKVCVLNGKTAFFLLKESDHLNKWKEII
jgi:hypothetical protein